MKIGVFPTVALITIATFIAIWFFIWICDKLTNYSVTDCGEGEGFEEVPVRTNYMSTVNSNINMCSTRRATNLGIQLTEMIQLSLMPVERDPRRTPAVDDRESSRRLIQLPSATVESDSRIRRNSSTRRVADVWGSRRSSRTLRVAHARESRRGSRNLQVVEAQGLFDPRGSSRRLIETDPPAYEPPPSYSSLFLNTDTVESTADVT